MYVCVFMYIYVGREHKSVSREDSGTTLNKQSDYGACVNKQSTVMIFSREWNATESAYCITVAFRLTKSIYYSCHCKPIRSFPPLLRVFTSALLSVWENNPILSEHLWGLYTSLYVYLQISGGSEPGNSSLLLPSPAGSKGKGTGL